jgi:hypothetical protein
MFLAGGRRPAGKALKKPDLVWEPICPVGFRGRTGAAFLAISVCAAGFFGFVDRLALNWGCLIDYQ